MNKKSFEKEKLKEESLNKRKQLNNQLAVQDQMEQMVKFESGEKSNLSVCSNEVGAVSKLSLSSDASFLHAPPSYFGSFPSTMSSVLKINQPVTNLDIPPTDYYNLFIKDLRYETRRQLGLRLDLERANVANWKSVADAIGFSNLEIQHFELDRYKFQAVLTETEVRFPDITVGMLCQILEDLDRQDVITDMERWFRRDLSGPGQRYPPPSRHYQSSAASPSPASFIGHGASNISLSSLPPTSCFPSFSSDPSVQVPHVTTTNDLTPFISTSEDQPISHPTPETSPPASVSKKDDSNTSLPPYPGPALSSPSSQSPATSFDLPQENYDAFLLFDVADRSFILDEFLPRIEGQAGLKLFIPGRDLPPGDHSFDAQLEAMLNRCPKLIVILSDEFIRSPTNRWGLNVALALDPAARRRKIIPVIYKRTTETSVLAGINACDRTRVLEDNWFWEGLVRSLNRQ